ncbi:EF-hand [Gloeopeniophorella convolvens]|nr:EF-hand [Gloeopeniophorella convolvens]
MAFAGHYGAQHGAANAGRFSGDAGGFAAPRHQAPPHGADPQLWSWFTAVDADRSGHISPPELQRALKNGDWTPFDIDTVKLLMNIFDTDGSGNIDFNEFSGLWRYIQEWQHVFRHFDADQSGAIDGTELRSALNQFGYELSPELLRLLVAKYATPPDGYQSHQEAISFDRFMRACVSVKQLTETFRKLDTDKDGWVNFSYEQFLGVFFSLP